MPFSRSRNVLTFILFSALVAFTGSTCPAQQPEKPDAPSKPQGPVQPHLGTIAAQAPYAPITGKQRIQWAAVETFGPASLMYGTLSAGIGTARDSPKEYGPHWDGFAKRYGMRFTGLATSHVMEAGFGAIWGEDPRYVRNQNLPFKRRVGNVLLLTVTARNRQGDLMPAYARFIAIPGSNFLANTWRVSSDATVGAALSRTAYGFLSQVGSNAWNEFWPDVKRRVFKRK
jgi:hypothetical protein